MTDSSLATPATASTLALEERRRSLIQSFGIRERILYKLSMKPADVSPFGYEAGVSGEWDHETALSLLRTEFPDFDDMIRGRRVMDYGCGDGFQSIAMAKSGAAEVFGVDITAPRLEHARQMAAGLPNIRFSTALERDGFDVVISQNSFEHFPDPAKNLDEMVAAIRPGGRILITFGPLWLAPYGAHMHFFTRCPWVNILFPEATVFRVRSLYRSDGSTRYFPGLNKMTLRKFERLVRLSGVRCVWRRYHATANLPIVCRVPGLRELLTRQVSCILTKDR